MGIDGPVSGEIFLAWGRQVLVPALRPGDVAITDDPARHEGAAAREAIEAAGAETSFRPPHGPDFNPVAYSRPPTAQTPSPQPDTSPGDQKLLQRPRPSAPVARDTGFRAESLR